MTYSSSQPISAADRIKAHDILVRQRALLVRGWTQGAFARKENGDKVGWTDPAAVSFCLAGAFKRASLDLQASLLADKVAYDAYWHAAVWEATKAHSPSIYTFNDDHNTTVDKVLSIVDDALTRI